MGFAVIREGEVVLGPGDGDEEQGAFVGQLAEGLGAGVELGVAVKPGDEDMREVEAFGTVVRHDEHGLALLALGQVSAAIPEVAQGDPRRGEEVVEVLVVTLMHRLALRDGPGAFEFRDAGGEILDLAVLGEQHRRRSSWLGRRFGQLEDFAELGHLAASLQDHGPATFFPDFRAISSFGAGVDVIADLEGHEREARHVPEDMDLRRLQDAADLGRGGALGVKGLRWVAGGDDVRGAGDDDLELLRGDVLDFVYQDVAILLGRVEEVVDRADFDFVGARFGQTHGRQVLQGVGVREVAYPGPAVLLEQQDGGMRQDDGLARAGISFDPMPTRRLRRRLADDVTLSRGKVFEWDEPIHAL